MGLIIDELRNLPLKQLEKVVKDAKKLLEKQSLEKEIEVTGKYKEEYKALKAVFKKLPKKIQIEVPVKLKFTFEFDPCESPSQAMQDDDFRHGFYPRLAINAVKTPETTKKQLEFINEILYVPDYLDSESLWDLIEDTNENKIKYKEAFEKLIELSKIVAKEKVPLSSFER